MSDAPPDLEDGTGGGGGAGEGEGLLRGEVPEDPMPECDRLTKARKSFSRCKSVDEESGGTPGGLLDPNLGPGPEDPLTADSYPPEDEADKVSERSAVGAAIDVLTASLSVIHLEKFALSKRRVSRMLPRCLHRTFVDPAVEQLFQVYHGRQRRQDLHCLLAAGLLLAAYTCIVSACLVHVPALVTGALLGALQMVLSALATRITLPERLWSALPYLVWCTITGQILLVLIIGPTAPTNGPHIMTPASPSGLIWVIVAGFLALVALPLRVPPCVALSFTTAAVYTAIAAAVSPAPHLGRPDPLQVSVHSEKFWDKAEILH